MVKLESRAQGKVNFDYKSAELRAKLPIGDKFSLSAGVIYRTHERPYGYNPVEIWLNETTPEGYPVNPWYTLGFYYGYDDIYYTQEDQNGNEIEHKTRFSLCGCLKSKIMPFCDGSHKN